jgi:hypothetical protein
MDTRRALPMVDVSTVRRMYLGSRQSVVILRVLQPNGHESIQVCRASKIDRREK